MWSASKFKRAMSASFWSSSATAESEREAATRFWAGDAFGDELVLIDAGLEAAGTAKGAVLRLGEPPVPELWRGWPAPLLALAALDTAAVAKECDIRSILLL
jgi:hypothetical protein